MGEALLYNINYKGANPDYDWNAAFNNIKFINEIVNKIKGSYTNYQLSIADNEYQNQNEMTAGYFPSCYQRIGSNAFDGCTSMSYVYFSSSRYDTNSYGSINIYELGDNAFKDCKSLQYVYMSAIRKIGKRAFYNCSMLYTFYGSSAQLGPLSEGYWMYSIDDEAFVNCGGSGLTLYGMSYIDRIGKSAFKDAKIRYTYVGNSICREIDDYAFAGCLNLTYIYLNTSMSTNPYCRCSLGSHIFENCNSLSNINIYGTYELYSYTFGDLKNCLQSVIFGAAYSCSAYIDQYDLRVDIHSHVFENYSLLSTAYISFVNEIGEYAFASCSKLTYINVGYNRLSMIRDHAFENCSGISYAYLNNDAFNFGLALKMSLDGSDIFKNCASLKSLYLYGCVNIPSYMFKSGNGTVLSDIIIGNIWGTASQKYGYDMSTIIGKEAFAFCSTLKWVGTGVADIIEESAFYMCSNMATFYFGSWLCGEIQSNALAGCSKIQYLSFNTSYSYIQSASSVALSVGDYAFSGCLSLESVNLIGVRYLGSNIFLGCMSIANLTIIASSTYELTLSSDTLYGAEFMSCGLYSFKTIKSDVFAHKGRLSNVFLYNCKEIEDYAFEGCYNLLSFTAPYTDFSVIKTHLFKDCPQLSSLNVPYVSIVESYAFQSNTNLSMINIPAASIIGEYAFNGCVSLWNVTVGPTCIGSHAFESCINLSYMTGPVRLISIYEYAFYNCTSFVSAFNFGVQTLEYIGSHAFDGCLSLKSIYLTGLSQPPVLESIDAFDNIDSDYIIYIPSTIPEQFLNHSVWGLLSDHLLWTGKGE